MMLKAIGISVLAYIIMHFVEMVQPKLDFTYLKQIPLLIIIMCIVYVMVKYAIGKIKEYSENQDSMIFKGI